MSVRSTRSNIGAFLTRKTAKYVLNNCEKDGVGCGRVGFAHPVA